MTERLSACLARKGRIHGYPEGSYMHWCPACRTVHHFAVGEKQRNGAQWSWEGDADLPTFSPSMNISYGPWPEDGRMQRCHYFLRKGRIEYFPDCTHALRGKTIPLPPIPDSFWQAWAGRDAATPQTAPA